MKELFQKRVGDIYDLTPKGVDIINEGPNAYSKATAPISSEDRDWSTKDIANLWVGLIVSIAVYQVASGLLVAGMNWYEALFTIILGHTIVMGVAIIIGHYGTRYGMTYPLLGKIIFGPKGLIFPSIVRGILGVFWFGVQAWIGGQATFIIISTLFPSFLELEFIGYFISFIIFWIINVYIAASGNKAVKYLEGFSAPVLILLSFVVIIWGFSTANWSLDTLLSAKVLDSKEGVGFWELFWPALSAMIAFDGGIALSMPDFTRNCFKQRNQIVGQLISAPLMTGYISFVGICGTAGAYLAFNKEIWEPAIIVGNFENAFIRILFSLFIIFAVLTTNVAGNLIPPINIVATYVRGRLSYKAVSIITASLALLARPWDSLSSAYHLIFDVTQLLGALLGPLTGIYIVSYFFELNKEIDMVDAFKTTEGKYYYNNGWNIKACILFIIFTAIIFVSREVPSLHFIFDNSYVYGVIITGFIYWLMLKLDNKQK